MMVGEVYLLSTEAVATYYGHGDELHLAFNFPPLFAPWLADRWRTCIADTVDGPRPPGSLADVGAVQPRQSRATAPATTAAAARAGEEPADRDAAERGAGPGGRRAPPHPPGHPVPLPGRGARTGRRRRSPTTGGSIPVVGTGAGRPCRGTGPTTTVGRRPPAPALAAVPPRRRARATGRPSGGTRRRSSTSTVGSSPLRHAVAGPRARDARSCSNCPKGCSASAGNADGDASTVVGQLHRPPVEIRSDGLDGRDSPGCRSSLTSDGARRRVGRSPVGWAPTRRVVLGAGTGRPRRRSTRYRSTTRSPPVVDGPRSRRATSSGRRRGRSPDAAHQGARSTGRGRCSGRRRSDATVVASGSARSSRSKSASDHSLSFRT